MTEPRREPADEAEGKEARALIGQLWPEHAGHLSPEGSKLGTGAIDPEEGVVCNCGDVLGHPVVQDPPEDPWGDDSDAPPWDTSDGPGPTKVETTGGGKDHDLPEGWQDAAREGFEGNPVAVDYAKQYAVMEARLAANPMDVEARAFVHGGMDSSGRPVQSDNMGGEESAVEAGWNDLVDGDPGGGVGDDPADEHASRTETVVDLPPMPDEWSDRNTPQPDPPGGPRGQLPVRRTSGVVPEDPISGQVVTIDPTLPYTPADIEAQLVVVEGRLERGIHFQRMWEERAAHAAAAWEIIYNRARRKFIGSAGSEKDRYALAIGEPEVEAAFLERHYSAEMVKMIRESMHTLRSLQSGYQSIARSVGNSFGARQPGA